MVIGIEMAEPPLLACGDEVARVCTVVVCGFWTRMDLWCWFCWLTIWAKMAPRPGSSWAGRAMSRWSTRLSEASWEAPSEEADDEEYDRGRVKVKRVVPLLALPNWKAVCWC